LLCGRRSLLCLCRAAACRTSSWYCRPSLSMRDTCAPAYHTQFDTVECHCPRQLG
jgi:hypothetical protein